MTTPLATLDPAVRAVCQELYRRFMWAPKGEADHILGAANAIARAVLPLGIDIAMRDWVECRDTPDPCPPSLGMSPIVVSDTQPDPIPAAPVVLPIHGRAQWPPDGWLPHPEAPGYFYSGQQCMSDADLRAMVEAGLV